MDKLEAKVKTYIDYQVIMHSNDRYTSLKNMLTKLIIYDMAIKFTSGLLGFTASAIVGSLLIYGMGISIPLWTLSLLAILFMAGFWFILSPKVDEIEHDVYKIMNTSVPIEVVKGELEEMSEDKFETPYLKINQIHRVLLKYSHNMRN